MNSTQEPILPVTIIENDPFDLSIPINLVGLISNVLAIIYSFGPVTLMIKIHKKILKPSDTPYMIMVTLVAMATFWISYGVLKPYNKLFIIACNVITAPVNLFYLALYFYYSCERKFLKSLVWTIPSILITVGVYLIFTYAIGIIEVSQYGAMIFNIAIYIAPGQNLVIFFSLRFLLIFLY